MLCNLNHLSMCNLAPKDKTGCSVEHVKNHKECNYNTDSRIYYGDKCAFAQNDCIAWLKAILTANIVRQESAKSYLKIH